MPQLSQKKKRKHAFNRILQASYCDTVLKFWNISEQQQCIVYKKLKQGWKILSQKQPDSAGIKEFDFFKIMVNHLPNLGT